MQSSASGGAAAQESGGVRERIEEQFGGVIERATGGEVNVGMAERWLSMLGGGALVARGLAKGGTGGLVTAALGAALAQRGLTGHCQVYGALGLDSSESGERGGLAGLAGGGSREVVVESVATVHRPAAELYRFWNDPTNLPLFMENVAAVEPIDERRARWTLQPPAGPPVEFEAVVEQKVEGERIAWHSAETAVLRHSGEVRFEEGPGGRGTTVRLRVELAPPGGAVGAAIAGLFDGAVELRMRGDLKRFKQLMETGEVATIEGQPTGPRD